MSTEVKLLREEHRSAWDDYVKNHTRGTLYHLSGWKNVIEKTYRHKTYYLIACENDQRLTVSIDWQQEAGEQSPRNFAPNTSYVAGILPLVHIKHFIFGNNLVSMPFLDYGGILAENENIEKALLSEAVNIGKELNAANLELRQIKPLYFFNGVGLGDLDGVGHNMVCKTSRHKVRMLLPVPNDAEALMKSFKSKLRNKIKKPIKLGYKAMVGRMELLDDFYAVFSTNMRDLGSPVHSKRLFKNIIEEFPDKAKFCIITQGSEVLAASVVIGFKDTLINPWASSLRKVSRFRPNTLLYWTMLKHACTNDYQYFDFGRSSPDEGTYKFKKQWGSEAMVLHWHYISLNEKPILAGYSEKSQFERAIDFWKKLPVPVTRILGPSLRKYIAL
jgi:serine/alanine adding enzyme